MVLYIRDIFEEDFVTNYLPKVIMTRIQGTRVKKNVLRINEVLKQTYGISVDDVLDAIEFSINKNNHVYSVSINNNIKEPKSQERIITLVKLIDYGTLNAKGLDIIDSSFKYVRLHLKAIYRSYKMFEGSV